MSAPVWVLSVDLQTRTASFQTGLGEAARSARSAFAEIKQGGNEMGRAVSGNMMEARHGVMLLGEEFGIHLPRALTTFIASIGPIGAAMEAAFPFLAIAVGATLLIQALARVHEAGQKLTEDQIKFGTAAQSALNALDDKLLQAGIRADELRNDHLGELAKQLELIDHQSMSELAHTFGELAKAADVVFGDITSHWYTFGIGSDGAKHALDQFQAQYESLLALGKDKEAADLLMGTRKSAEHILEMQKQALANTGDWTGPKEGADLGASQRALIELQKAGVGVTDNEVAAQEALVDTLNKQLTAEGKIAELKKMDSANARRGAAGAMSSQASAAAREAAESQTRMGTAAVGADKAVAEAQLTIKRGSVEERLALDIDFANREFAVQMAGNAALIAGLNKLGTDYPNQLKELQDKALELTAQNANTIAELTAKTSVAAAARDLQILEQSEREKIELTQRGTQDKLAAINAALKQEESLNLQDTAFYRELQSQRVQGTEQALEEDRRLSEEAGIKAAENEQKIGELKLAAFKANQALQDSAHRISMTQKVAEETQAANAEYALQIRSNAQKLAALDKSGKDYQNKLKELQDKEKQLDQQHENEVAAIREKAEEEQNQRILAARQKFDDAIASSLTKSIMGHQSWAKTLDTLGDQMISGMIQNTLKYILNNKSQQMSDARAAAASAYKSGEQIGGPIGLILGPTFAAAAFAGVMAFERGGIVPGVGRGDIVPSMLTPGEGVVPGSMMDKLNDMANRGGMAGGTTNHVHMHVTQHLSALDGDGMTSVLEKHADQLHQHITNTLRKMNK